MAEWMDLTGKVIIVTGGSRGIGEHVVKILRRNNAIVIVADLTPNPDYESDDIFTITPFFCLIICLATACEHKKTPF